MMRKKALEYKKRKLDEQAAASLTAKRAKLQKETPPAPSESEVDLEAFTEKYGNLLEKIFVASDSREEPGDVEIEQVGEGGAGGAGGTGGDGVDGGDGRGKGVETEAESSQATPRHTIYTKRPPGGGGGATSKVHQSPEFKNVRAGSWDTHNPACDDLLHAPRWRLT
ncbi:hypothetical protein HanXRQr2_Chr17g0789251 [Helianthus annuus]|uniref:Uncharacterized protein n=1 Tax=Helianthus annuus TaxID=4232 RepID=A0A9K3DG05_HELAN|nr:hypothetical protein HanXRQr2_Chr17g0789251 [Helianthus annuus]KAJ0432230.1 hypothetical protein HanIR_Chr17g0856951 [Helianthus annuus]KAJ0631444.1 hypothetical protein HanLR1_Chr17g0654031 [Helianthus annuus]